MITRRNYTVDDTMKKCLVELDFIFQWLAMTENKKLKTEYAEMGSNFAKFKIYPEYNSFIDYACEAEKHFSGVTNGNYHSVGNDCRLSLEGFMTYLYEKKNLKINEEFFKHTSNDEKLWNESNRVKISDKNQGEKNPTGYVLGTKKGKDGKPQKIFWLDAAITSDSFQKFFEDHKAWPNPKEKKLAAEFSHYNFSKEKNENFYSGDKAVSILSMIFNLYSHCVEKKFFSGTPRFDISLLKNAPSELIKPILEIENNGRLERIPQNELLIAVQKKDVSESFVKEKISFINKTDVLGNTPLSLAIYNDDFETVSLLLENGADPNFYFKNSCKDFYKSVSDEISKYESKYSCVLSEYIKADNCIPLIIALKKDNTEITKLLLKYSAKTWDSCIDDYYSFARIPTECSTLLTCAIFYNANACVNMLLDEDILDNSGKKIEILIDPEWTDTLHNYGSRPTYGTIEGVTALMLAAENGDFDIVDQLLDKGARLDVLDNCRNSVFLHAVQNPREKNVLGKLLREGEKSLGKEKLAELINHAGLAGCPLSYVNVNDAKLLLKYGADVNAKNEWGVLCIADTALISPELIPWMKEHGAKLNFKELFLNNNYLEIEYEMRRFSNQYSKENFNRILNSCSDLLTPEILNLNVPIDNIPQISPLIDTIIFSKAQNIQMAVDYGKEKQEKCFLSDEQLTELNKKFPLIRLLSNGKLLSYSHIRENYNTLVKWVNEGFSGSNLDFNIDMTLEDVYQAVASERELSKKQKIELFKKYPFIKNLEMAGIDPNDQSEVESTFNAEKIIFESLGETINWEMNPTDIKNAIDNIKASVSYEDFKITPLDDALIGKNYDAAAIYLSKEIQVSQFTKLLLLSVHNISENKLHEWNKVLSELGLRKDVDFTDVLLLLCKNHPKNNFDIAKEFLNNGYNYYRFAKNVFPMFVKERMTHRYLNYNYNNQNLPIRNEDGTYNMSPSIEDIRIRNNNEFLSFFNETSFQDVNLRLIRKAISFGANPNIQDDDQKSAVDYAKINGIDESIFIVENEHDIYDFSVDMPPSQKGAIRGHIEINGEIVKGSIAKQLIPEGTVASDYNNQKLKVILISELQTKQAGDPYYKLDFAP